MDQKIKRIDRIAQKKKEYIQEAKTRAQKKQRVLDDFVNTVKGNKERGSKYRYAID